MAAHRPASRASLRHSRRWVSQAIAATAAAILVAPGCSSPHSSAQPAAESAMMPVDPAHSATLRLPGGMTVSVPAGAVTRPGTLSATLTSAPARAPSGLKLTGPVYDLRLSGTILRGDVRLTVPVILPRPQDQSAAPNAALLVYYSRSSGGWQPVNASYDPATHVLTATSRLARPKSAPGLLSCIEQRDQRDNASRGVWRNLRD